MSTLSSLTFRINSIYNGDGLRQARRDMTNLDSSLNALSKSTKALKPSMADFVSVILGLGPALVPIAGGLLGIGVAAGSAMASAGAAIGVYGFAMMGAIKTTIGAGSAFSDTNKAVDKARAALDDAIPGTKAYAKANKDLTEALKNHEKALKAMPPVQEKFARTFEKSKNAMMDFNESNAKFTLGPATTALETFIAALPKLSTVVRAMAPEVQRVADLLKSWVTNGGLDRFIKFIKSYGIPAFHGFVDALRSLFGALGKGMRDTAPLGTAFIAWLTKAMAAFKSWAAGGGFERFLAWLAANKGALIQVAKDLGTALGNIGQAIGNMSGNAFIVFGTFLKVLASFPPGLLQAMAYAWITWTAAMKLWAVYMTISNVVGAASLIWLSPMGPLLLGIVASVLIWVAALAAVGVAIFFLVKYWDQIWAAIKTAAVTVWGWLVTAWNATWNAIKTAALAVWNFLTNGWGQFLLLFMGPVGMLIALIANWDLIWNTVKNVALAVWTWLQMAWTTFVNALYTAWLAAIAPIVESWNTIWPQLREAALNIWNALKVAWDFLWTQIQTAWLIFWTVFGPFFQAAWTSLVAIATAVWTTLQAAWQFLWTTIQSIFNVAWAIFSAIWNVAWSVLTGVAQVAWSILQGAWSVLWSVITGIWNTFYAIFAAIFSGAWNVISAIATGVWNVIKAAWSALWAVVTAIFLTFTAIFTGNWGMAWNAIKDAAQAVWNVIRTAWQAFLNVLQVALSAFVGVFKAAWSAFWAALQAIGSAAWAAFRATFQTFLTAVQNVWNTAWNAVRTILQTVVTAAQAIASAAWSAMRTALNAFLEAARTVWNSVWTAIRTFFSTVAEAVQSRASALWATLRGIFSAGSTWLRETFWNPVSNFFTKTIPSAFDAAAKALGKAWDAIRNLVRKPIQAIVDVVYNSGIRKLWNVVAGVFGAKDLPEFKLPAFKEGGPTGGGSGNGFLAKVHPGEHVWTRQEVAGAGGHQAVAKLRSQAMGGAKVRDFGEHSFKDGGGILGTGLGPKVGPDLVPDGIIDNIKGGIGSVVGKLKDLALGAISGPFGAAVDGVAKLGKAAVKAAIPGSGTQMEKLGVGIIDKMAKTIKDWVEANDIAPDTGGGGGFVPWAKWKSGDGTHVNYGGVTVNRRTAAMLKNAAKLAKTSLQMFQGSYSNSVGASAGTHSGGGAADLGPAKDSIVGAMRGSGFAAWRRTPAEGFSPHVHGIAVGDPTVSSAAAAQVRAFKAGKNGLADNGPDTYKGGITSGKSVAAAKATGKSMNAARGWGSQWSSLEALWNRESGWRWNADNPSSSAYGIPQCVDLNTQILTRRGWLRHDEVRVGDETIAYSPEAGRSEWTRVTEIHHGTGELREFGTSWWRGVSTPNHRWLVERVDPLCDLPPDTDTIPPGECQCGCGSEVTLAKNTIPEKGIVRGQPNRYVHGHHARGRRRDSNARDEFMVEQQDFKRGQRVVLARPADTDVSLDITVQEAALLAWIAGDGWQVKPKPVKGKHPTKGYKSGSRPMTYHIAQTKEENWSAIDAAVGENGRVTRTRERMVNGEVRHDREWRLSAPYARDLTERAGNPKSDCVQQVLSMSTAQREAWLVAMIQAEGHVAPQKGGRRPITQISQKAGPLADAIVLAVYLSGRRPSVYVSRRLGGRHGPVPVWTITIASPHTGEPRESVGGKPCYTDVSLGVQDVWCVTTELGTWTARQGNDVFLTGNSLPGSKMKSSGADWKTNPATQIKWGLGYIKSRYGNPSKANSFQKSHNWYGLGTPGASRGPAVVGEHEPEIMNLRGGERIDPLSDLIGRGGGDIHVDVNIPISGRADHGVVDRLERETIPKLTMAIKQGVGRRN